MVIGDSSRRLRLSVSPLVVSLLPTNVVGSVIMRFATLSMLATTTAAAGTPSSLFDARPTRGVGNKTCDELPEIVSYHIHGARRRGGDERPATSRVERGRGEI